MPTLTESQIRKMKKDQLKAALKERSLPYTGLKATLVSRLLKYIKENEEISVNDDNDESVDNLLNGDNASLDNNENDDDEIDNLLNEGDDIQNNDNKNDNNDDNDTSNTNDNEKSSPKTSQKFMNQFEKIIKKQERIARFGMTQETDKINARKARFGGKTDFSIKSLMDDSTSFSIDLLEKRRKRWGDEAISLSMAKEKATRGRRYIDVDEEIKKEQRKNRFGTSNGNDGINLNNDDITFDNDKIQSRMKRFGTDLNTNVDDILINKKRKMNNNGIYISDDDDIFRNPNNVREQNDNLLDMSLDELNQMNRRNRNRRFNNRSRRGRFYNNNNMNGRTMRGRGFNRGRPNGDLWRQRRNQQRLFNNNNNNTNNNNNNPLHNFDRSRSRRNRNSNYRPFIDDDDFDENTSNNFEDFDHILNRPNNEIEDMGFNDFDDLDDLDTINDIDDGIHDFVDNDIDDSNNGIQFKEDPVKRQARLLRFEKDWR